MGKQVSGRWSVPDTGGSAVQLAECSAVPGMAEAQASSRPPRTGKEHVAGTEARGLRHGVKSVRQGCWPRGAWGGKTSFGNAPSFFLAYRRKNILTTWEARSR